MAKLNKNIQQISGYAWQRTPPPPPPPPPPPTCSCMHMVTYQAHHITDSFSYSVEPAAKQSQLDPVQRRSQDILTTYNYTRVVICNPEHTVEIQHKLASAKARDQMDHTINASLSSAAHSAKG